MRRITMSLLSTSVIALAVASSPAAAQTSDPVTPPDPTVEAQESPADPEAGSVETDDAVQTTGGADQATPADDTIIVTGIRRSIQSAQSLKRNSEQIVDAIVAEDIGKLPDVSASAALARVPGVQVQRAAAEAYDVRIRGLPDISTTYNSREIFTAENRFVAIQDFPAGGVAALEVFKSGTANLIEGGLGGQVNVRGRRPFDFKNREISGSFNIVKFEQSGNWDWNGNVLFSDRWNVGDGGEMGFLINGSVSNIDFLDSTREQAEFIQFWVPTGGPPGEYREAGGGEQSRPDAVRAPDAQAVFFGQGDRSRPSVNGAFQYKPNADLQFYVDGLFQGYRGEDSALYYRVPLYCNPTLTNVVLDGNQIESATANGGCEVFGRNEYFDDKTNTYQFGGGVIYDFAPFRASGDIAYTDSRYSRRQVNIDVSSFGNPERVHNFDISKDPGGPTFDLIGIDPTDPEDYRASGVFFFKRKASGKNIQGRADLEWTTGLENLPRVQFGARHSVHKARQRNTQQFGGTSVSYANLPISPKLLYDGFAYDNVMPEEEFLGFDFDDVHDGLEDLRDFVGLPSGDPDWDPLQEFRSKEKATAGYAQLKYEFDAGFPIDGLIGLRAVRTKLRVSGTRRDNELGVNVPIDVTNTYTDYLPNASVRLQFRPDLQARLAYTQTRSRPSFFDLRPNATIGTIPAVCDTDPDDENCFRSADGGNPDLRPIESNNWDATLEYYPTRTSSLTMALFYRKVDGFIFGQTFDVVDPELGRLRFNQPGNAGKGKIKGFEIAGTMFFDFEWVPNWAQGFGVQANYTYVDASTELAPPFDDRLPGQQRFPGISKHSYNLTGIYEKGPFSARLAYNFRGKFVVEYQTHFGFTAPRMEDDHGVLDFSASYTPFENVTFAFDALNILAGDPIKTYRAYNEEGDTFPFQRRYLERVYSFGVRFRMGGGEPRVAEAPAPVLPPPPPPPVEPAPVVEQPAPPPPPPPVGERG